MFLYVFISNVLWENMCAYMWSSDLPQDEEAKVHSLLEGFENAFRESVGSKKLNPILFPMFRFHHIFIGIDAAYIHLVYTTEGVSSLLLTQL